MLEGRLLQGYANQLSLYTHTYAQILARDFKALFQNQMQRRQIYQNTTKRKLFCFAGNEIFTYFTFKELYQKIFKCLNFTNTNLVFRKEIVLKYIQFIFYIAHVFCFHLKIILSRFIYTKISCFDKYCNLEDPLIDHLEFSFFYEFT